MIDHTLPWGSSGVNGTEPTVFKPLCELTSEHLNNILACCGHMLLEDYKLTIYDILERRGVKPLRDVTDTESRKIHAAYMTKRAVCMRNGVK